MEASILRAVLIPVGAFLPPLYSLLWLKAVDTVDFSGAKLLGWMPPDAKGDAEYQKRDKVLDFFGRIVLLQTYDSSLLWQLHWYRSLGELFYFSNPNPIAFVIFPDLVDVLFLAEVMQWDIKTKIALTAGKIVYEALSMSSKQ